MIIYVQISNPIVIIHLLLSTLFSPEGIGLNNSGNYFCATFVFMLRRVHGHHSEPLEPLNIDIIRYRIHMKFIGWLTGFDGYGPRPRLADKRRRQEHRHIHGHHFDPKNLSKARPSGAPVKPTWLYLFI